VRALIAATVVMLGCGSALPALPSQGGAPWREVATDHFTLWTDSSSERARELVTQLEHQYVIFSTALAGGKAHGRVLVIAPRIENELRAFLPPGNDAYIAMSAALQFTVIADAYPDDRHQLGLAYVVAQAISHGVVYRQPAWLEDGIGSFLETARVRDGQVQLGTPPAERVRFVRRHDLMPTTDLFACDDRACNIAWRKATAWVLFEFLVGKHVDELDRYLIRLAELPPDSFAQAWREVFPALPPGPQLDKALHDFITYEALPTIAFRDPELHVQPAERMLSEPEIAALRAVARLQFLHDRAGALEDAATALAGDPTNLIATLVKHAADSHAVTVDTARAVAAAHDSDWRAWWLIERIERDAKASDADDAHARMCAAAAADPSAAIDPQLCAAPAR
jgi:hypothetical protein